MFFGMMSIVTILFSTATGSVAFVAVFLFTRMIYAEHRIPPRYSRVFGF